MHNFKNWIEKLGHSDCIINLKNARLTYLHLYSHRQNLNHRHCHCLWLLINKFCGVKKWHYDRVIGFKSKIQLRLLGVWLYNCLHIVPSNYFIIMNLNVPQQVELKRGKNLITCISSFQAFEQNQHCWQNFRGAFIYDIWSARVLHQHAKTKDGQFTIVQPAIKKSHVTLQVPNSIYRRALPKEAVCVLQPLIYKVGRDWVVWCLWQFHFVKNAE